MQETPVHKLLPDGFQPGLSRFIPKSGRDLAEQPLEPKFKRRVAPNPGLPSPGFRQEGGEFVQTLWRPEPAEAPAEGTEQVTGQVESAEEELSAEVQRLLHVMTGEMARRDIQERLGLKHREHFYNTYLTPALAAGMIERTVPDNPTSRRQRYRLTEKGRAWLAAREQ